MFVLCLNTFTYLGLDGERGYRYTLLDLGHALINLRLAAAHLGWSLYVVQQPGTKSHEKIFGLDRMGDFPERKEEQESLDVLLLVTPTAVSFMLNFS